MCRKDPFLLFFHYCLPLKSLLRLFPLNHSTPGNVNLIHILYIYLCAISVISVLYIKRAKSLSHSIPLKNQFSPPLRLDGSRWVSPARPCRHWGQLILCGAVLSAVGRDGQPPRPTLVGRQEDAPVTTTTDVPRHPRTFVARQTPSLN